MSDIKNYTIEDVNEVNQARFFNDYILDSDGHKVDLNDPRVVYVLPEARNSYGRRLVKDLYASHNKNVRISEETDAATLNYGKKICSGRECLPCVAITGAVFKRY